MKVHHRLLLVLLLLLGGFVGVHLWDTNRQAYALSLFFDSFLRSESSKLDTLIKVNGESLETFARDYSWWDEMVVFIEERDQQWWVDQMTGACQLFGADQAWLLDTQLRCIGTATQDEVPEQADVPFFLPELREAQGADNYGHFFVQLDGTLWELRMAGVQPSSDFDRSTPVHGYFVAGRRWDADMLAHLGELTGARLEILPPARIALLPPTEGDMMSGVLRIVYPLQNPDKSVVSGLVMTSDSPMLALIHNQVVAGRRWTFMGLGGAGILSLILCILWVTRPLSVITQALETNDMSLLNRLSQRRSEMGLIARLVVSEATQRVNLETAVRKRGDAETKLAQREQFLSTILRHLNGVVLVISQDGILNLAEGRELEAYGLRKERDEGRPINRILRGQERLIQFESALNGERLSGEQQVGGRYFLTACEPLTGPDGKVQLVVVMALDITEKKQVESALLKAKQEAERTDKLKSQFLSVMSHETRTPLNGVLGFAGVLRDTDLTDEQRVYLDRIVESAQNLLRLLTDILDLTRLEAGENTRRDEQVSLAALIYQFAERYRLVADKKGLDFELEVDPQLPDYIDTDVEKVSRILSSLLDNAVKFTDRGGVRFIVTASRDRQGRRAVLFTVADSGPGIPKDLARHIFDPFQQGDSSKTHRHGGLGLGLTIAHRLARQVDGALTFESEPGKGSRFALYLPLDGQKAAPSTGRGD